MNDIKVPMDPANVNCYSVIKFQLRFFYFKRYNVMIRLDWNIVHKLLYHMSSHCLKSLALSKDPLSMQFSNSAVTAGRHSSL